MVDYSKWDQMTFSSSDDEGGDNKYEEERREQQRAADPPPQQQQKQRELLTEELGESFLDLSPLEGNERVLAETIRLKKKQCDTLEGHSKEFCHLDELLASIPLKRKHKIMVPLAKGVGMMDGYITHTNEITVNLGEQYFAKRTAPQARDILQRRKKYVDDSLQQLNEEIERLKVQILAGNQIFEPLGEKGGDGVREITEPYDSDEEKKKYSYEEEEGFDPDEGWKRTQKYNKMSTKELIQQMKDPQLRKQFEDLARLEALEEDENSAVPSIPTPTPTLTPSSSTLPTNPGDFFMPSHQTPSPSPSSSFPAHKKKEEEKVEEAPPPRAFISDIIEEGEIEEEEEEEEEVVSDFNIEPMSGNEFVSIFKQRLMSQKKD